MDKIETIFIPAKIEVGKMKNQLATTNNIPYWYRFQKTKIKNTFKEYLKDWHFPVSDKMYESAEIRFTILRHDKRTLDPDSLASNSYKWAIDTLVEQKYLKDDDNIRIILEPTVYSNNHLVETSVSMVVDFIEVR